MDSITKYEIKALAFQIMNGHMAPGKDSPAAAGPTDLEERNQAWSLWSGTHHECVEAMLKAFDRVNGWPHETR